MSINKSVNVSGIKNEPLRELDRVFGRQLLDIGTIFDIATQTEPILNDNRVCSTPNNNTECVGTQTDEIKHMCKHRENVQNIANSNPQKDTADNVQSITTNNPQNDTADNVQNIANSNPQKDTADNVQSITTNNPQNDTADNVQNIATSNPQKDTADTVKNITTNNPKDTAEHVQNDTGNIVQNNTSSHDDNQTPCQNTSTLPEKSSPSRVRRVSKRIRQNAKLSGLQTNTKAPQKRRPQSQSSNTNVTKQAKLKLVKEIEIDLTVYIKNCKLTKAGCKRDELLEYLTMLKKVKLGEFSNNDFKKCVQIPMEETFKLRLYEIHENNMRVREAATIFKGLRYVKFLPLEYDLIYDGSRMDSKSVLIEFKKLIMANFKRQLKNRLGHNALEAVASYEKDPQNKDLEWAVAVALYFFKKTNDVFTDTLAPMPEEMRLHAPGNTPYIDLETIDQMWSPSHETKIVVEQYHIATASNFFEALMACYFYYWIFYLEYSQRDRILFEDLDQIVECHEEKLQGRKRK